MPQVPKEPDPEPPKSLPLHHARPFPIDMLMKTTPATEPLTRALREQQESQNPRDHLRRAPAPQDPLAPARPPDLRWLVAEGDVAGLWDHQQLHVREEARNLRRKVWMPVVCCSPPEP